MLPRRQQRPNNRHKPQLSDPIRPRKEKNQDTIKFIPPISPYHLIEEQLFDDPWKLLTATIFLNKTPLKSCKNHLEWFFNEIESPQKLLETEITVLEKFFEPLGLKRTRATQIYYMTHDYLFKNWKSVEEIYGIGEYGRDAYNMFCLGKFDVEPKDRYLRIYKNWYLKVYLGNNNNDLSLS
ncbi:methyl-CpG-binding domain protein 4-like [Onthophagus taurus]|uniref:methyl-CpG-binding domain protein 4-like n=1 Tax=Onthophagus taurus TaxID=166361 RepID=UPI000C1FF828|nr:methyl-CpG-binding domain protein 4-like [Onthophagus taurus]XP_022911195.1 methyl-CpG-binding domain protein 4-like [Onthophagus taurus]